jgi:hypothetical protein
LTTVTRAYNRIYSRTYGAWGRFRDGFIGFRDAWRGVPRPHEELGALRFYRLRRLEESPTFARLVDLCEKALAGSRTRLKKLLRGAGRSFRQIVGLREEQLSQFRLDQYCSANGMDTPKPITGWSYWIPFFVMAGLESPLNVQAVQVFFGGSVLSYALVLGVLIGLVLMFLAHIAGGAVSDLHYRLWPPTVDLDGNPSRMQVQPLIVGFYAAVLAAALIVTGFVIYALGTLRQYSFDVWQQEAQTSFTSIFEGGFQETITASFAIELGPEGYLIMLINAAFFALGSYLAYRHRIADPVIARLHRGALLENEVRSLALDLANAFDELLEKRRVRAVFVLARLTVYRDANRSFRGSTAVVAFDQIDRGVQDRIEEDIYARSELEHKFTLQTGESYDDAS